MAEDTSQQPGDKPSYTRYLESLHEERQLRDQHDTIDREIKWLEQTVSFMTINSTDPSNDPALQTVVKHTQDKTKKKDDIVSIFQANATLLYSTVQERKIRLLTAARKGPARKDGPFVRALEEALASFNVCRQAYYSGTFVGNHIHRALKVETLITLIIMAT